MGGFFLRIL